MTTCTQTQPLQNTLAEIESWLRAYRPNLYDELLPPASENQILVAEKTIGQKLPSELIAMYRWHNGQPATASHCFCFLTGSYLLSLEGLCERWQIAQALVQCGQWNQNQWRSDWIPFLANSGDGVFYFKASSPDQGAILYKNDYVLRRGRTAWASLSDWLQTLNAKALLRIQAGFMDWEDDFPMDNEGLNRYWS